MPELTAAAVQRYTNERLDKDDPETARLLSAALATARRWCGWHVTPVKTGHVVKLDGRGGRMLRLPTFAVVTLTSAVEEGVTLDVNSLYVSDLGMLEKKSGASWSSRFGAITVTMDHGYPEAPDFDSAVLSLINRESLAPAGGRAKVVGPFQYDLDPIGSDSAFTAGEQAKLEQYRLERPA